MQGLPNKNYEIVICIGHNDRGKFFIIFFRILCRLSDKLMGGSLSIGLDWETIRTSHQIN